MPLIVPDLFQIQLFEPYIKCSKGSKNAIIYIRSRDIERLLHKLQTNQKLRNGAQYSKNSKRNVERRRNRYYCPS